MSKLGKHSFGFKLDCVKAVLENQKPIKTTARYAGIDGSELRLWVGLYKYHGEDALKDRQRVIYEESFKLKVLETIKKDYLSLYEACYRFNIPSPSLIRRWRYKYELKRVVRDVSNLKIESLQMEQMEKFIKNSRNKKNEPLTREEEILLENKYLKAENALLKKLHALIQERKK